jgi:hypothetical protein
VLGIGNPQRREPFQVAPGKKHGVDRRDSSAKDAQQIALRSRANGRVKWIRSPMG